MGMSSPEWSRYMHDVIGLAGVAGGDQRRGRPAACSRGTRSELPLIDGAVEAVERLAGVVSTRRSRRRRTAAVIDAVLATSGLAPLFEATVSSEEVARGKPAPDVFLEAARRLGVAPERCAAVEDSGNGIRAAHAAGMRVIAIPNRRYPPPADALALADVVLDELEASTGCVIE